jgi:DNA-binding NarL/FixJ family response regulator
MQMGQSQVVEIWREAANSTQYNGLSHALQQNALSREGSDLDNVDANENQHRNSLVVIVDKRALERECLARGLVEHNPALAVTAVGSLDEFHNLPSETDASAILVVLGGRKVSDPRVRAELSQFVEEYGGVSVIVVADSDEPSEILAALECGARGYIPTSVKIRVAAGAIALACAGGTFVPASGVLALREMIHANANTSRPLTGMFTTREAAVVEALRKGKANKIIAYELNLCESTVKVHIRNVMKKLKATNRTEVAYKLREMSLG